MPTKIDIISGVLGAGKTTLINRMLDGGLNTEKIAIVENEFGEIGVDGSRFAASGVTIKEISNGCICCSLFGDFVSATRELISRVCPDRIIVEPTGVGKLTDVLKALEAVGKVESIKVNMIIAVLDPLRYELFLKMFGEFYTDQIQTAKTIFLSRTQEAPDRLIEKTIEYIRGQNQKAVIIDKPWDELTGAGIVSLGEKENGPAFRVSLDQYKKETHHHDSNEGFTVWSTHTSRRYSREQFLKMIHTLENGSRYGEIVRGKGIFQTPEGRWFQYDHVPQETRFQTAEKVEMGKIVFIGKNLNASELEDLFGSLT